MTQRLLTLALSLAALSACAPAQVSFVCLTDEPLCTIGEVLEDERPLATGIDITAITLYQGVERPLMVDGALVEDGPAIVANRDAVFRVFVTPAADWEPRTITARVYLTLDGAVVGAQQADLAPSGASSVQSLGSTFNLRIPGASLSASSEAMVQWSVELVELDDSVRAGGKDGVNVWPESGTAELPVEDAGPVRILLVPVEYNADGSGRLPDTSEGQLELYRQHMLATYPASDVEIEVSEPLSTNVRVDALGTGWDRLLSEVGNARQSLGADDDQYLYGAFNPANSFGEFCGNGCVLGLSNLAGSAGDAFQRASIGIGYPGTDATETMIHEVGHAHGRNHSPGCGAAGADPGYPNRDGYLDVWGYDLRSDTLKDPAAPTYDFMSYCPPTWTSEFTWDGLFDRVSGVNRLYNSRAVTVDWMALWVYSDGSLGWGVDHPIVGSPGGEPRLVELLDEKGRSLGTLQGWFSPFDHVSGGVLTLPQTDLPFVTVLFDGRFSPPR